MRYMSDENVILLPFIQRTSEKTELKIWTKEKIEQHYWALRLQIL